MISSLWLMHFKTMALYAEMLPVYFRVLQNEHI